MKKSNNINTLRTRSNIHHTEEMKQYVMDLWMEGTREHVIDKLVEKKAREMRFRNKLKKSA